LKKKYPELGEKFLDGMADFDYNTVTMFVKQHKAEWGIIHNIV
jgi:hypothetical protein